MGENTHQNCTRQNKNKEDPGRQQPCWGLLFCTNLTQPTGALDKKTGKQIMDLLHQVVLKNGIMLLIVTHDLDIAKTCNTIFEMDGGRLQCVKYDS
jgi:ABC-type hemin transport system ATPase subunit